MVWDLHIWDQGAVWGEFGMAPTNRSLYGLRVSDFPGKFIVHVPQLRGDYPTREGLGRELGDWFLLKRLAARGAAAYLERFAKPFALASYNTAEPAPNTGPRVAQKEDIDAAEAAMGALGVGSLSNWVHPDCITVDMKTPDVSGGTSKLGYLEFLQFANGEISKAVATNTFTTETGKYGSRSTAEVGVNQELVVARYDAACFGETLRRDLCAPLARLNFPSDHDLVPRVKIHVEDEPAPSDVMDLAVKAASIGVRLAQDDLAKKIGLKVVEEGDENAVRLALVKPVDLSAIDESITPPAPPQPLQPNGGEQAKPEDAGKADEGEKTSPEEKTQLGDFAFRMAAFNADIREARDNGLLVDVDQLAELHGVPGHLIAGRTH